MNNKYLETWLDPIEYLSTGGSAERPRIVLGVPNALHQYYVTQNLQEQIYTEISDTYKSQFEVEFVITGNKPPLNPENPLALDEAIHANEQAHLRPHGLPSQPPPVSNHQKSTSDFLNSELTFSTFVVGKNSEFAHAASFNVARNPGADDYNPLYIYGPVDIAF